MEKKLRHSRQREGILRYLLSTDEHPSADMIYERLRGEMPGLSLGTVYRNLRLLEETGQVRRVAAGQNFERYDACRGDHAHFICEECGCVRDLNVLDIEAAGKTLGAANGDSVRWINVILGGKCSACINKSV